MGFLLAEEETCFPAVGAPRKWDVLPQSFNKCTHEVLEYSKVMSTGKERAGACINLSTKNIHLTATMLWVRFVVG